MNIDLLPIALIIKYAEKYFPKDELENRCINCADSLDIITTKGLFGQFGDRYATHVKFTFCYHCKILSYKVIEWK